MPRARLLASCVSSKRSQHFPDRTDLAVSAKWLELSRNRQYRQIRLWTREGGATRPPLSGVTEQQATMVDDDV